MLTLQFSTEVGPASALIRWWSWANFSHVDGVLPDGRLLGARLHGGVAIRACNYARFSRVQRVTIPAPAAALDFAREQLGTPYDWTAILAFGLRRDWQRQDKWFCSELWAAALVKAGYLRLPTDTIYRITPRDLLLMLSAHPVVTPPLRASTP